MENLTTKIIKVSGIESNNNKITLLEQEEGKQYPVKYSFFQTKQDGTESKAYSQFLSLGVSIGKVYEIAVKETQGVNKMSGKPVTYRNIAFFVDGTPRTPSTRPETPIQSTANFTLTPEYALIVNTINDLKKRVHGLEMLVVNTDNEKGYQFHQDTIDLVKKEDPIEKFNEDNQLE